MNRYILFLSFLTLSACENEIDHELDKKSYEIGQHADVRNSGQQFICYFPPMPTFPGGIKSLIEFINTNLEYPPQYPEGRVFIEFTVTEDGSVSDVKVLKGLCELCDKNAIGLFYKIPKWTPAKIQGKAVKAKMLLPVKFK